MKSCQPMVFVVYPLDISGDWWDFIPPINKLHFLKSLSWGHLMSFFELWGPQLQRFGHFPFHCVGPLINTKLKRVTHAASTGEIEAVPWEMIDKAQGTQNKRSLARKGRKRLQVSQNEPPVFFFVTRMVYNSYIISIDHFLRYCTFKGWQLLKGFLCLNILQVVKFSFTQHFFFLNPPWDLRLGLLIHGYRCHGKPLEGFFWTFSRAQWHSKLHWQGLLATSCPDLKKVLEKYTPQN